MGTEMNGITVGMGTTLTVLPWGWERLSRYYRGDGDDSHGITVGMGTTRTVLPWGWGRLSRDYRGDEDDSRNNTAIVSNMFLNSS